MNTDESIANKVLFQAKLDISSEFEDLDSAEVMYRAIDYINNMSNYDFLQYIEWVVED
jgi:hypothetical protein